MIEQDTRNSAVPSPRRSPLVTALPVDPGSWLRAYSAWLVVTDVVAVLVAVGVAYLVRFDIEGLPAVSGEFSPTYLSVSLVLAVAWLVSLSLMRSRDRRLLGTGSAEYSRVFTASWRLFAVVAVIGFLLRMDFGRGYLALAAPLGCLLLLLGRWGWRSWLRTNRQHGKFQSGILVLGHREQATVLIDELHRNPGAGYAVIGVCVPSGEVEVGETIGGVPVLGSMDDAAAVAVEIKASAVAVSGSDSITADAVRRLGWDLEGTDVDLALTLALVDVAGPRVTMQPVSGLPLMYVDEARFTGFRYVAKSVFDWVSAAMITILLMPAILVIALLVACSSRGPVFYTQERIGKDGRNFRMIKFRSMQADAHSRLAEVLAAEGIDEIGLFYKPKSDPRVTRVGRILRQYSLDELPQLFNVLRGEMSLVGPRPQIAAEVAQYDRAAHRRLLVKPGLTGLWQVSGRSDLSVHEGIRADVRYAENWTLIGDFAILLRTIRVVLRHEGAR